MRAVLQRVSEASVTVEQQVVGHIAHGLLVLLGIAPNDTLAEARLLAEKTVYLRIFADAEGRFNRSVLDAGGAILVVSQFTLYADVRKGRRPGFSQAAPPDIARPLVDAYITGLRSFGITVATGVFGATMQVALVNDGPVTIFFDSEMWKETQKHCPQE